MTQIAFINQSTVVSDADAQTVMAALQKQTSNEFYAAWGIDAKLNFVSAQDVKGVDPSWWWHCILDNADQAGCLGYHDLTPSGLPLAKTFAGTDKQYGTDWAITASHENCECLADPDVNLMVLMPDGTFWCYESADAVEDDTYQIDGINVSNFVFPSWFETFQEPSGAKFDQMGLCTQALQLRSGGYIGVYDPKSGAWNQITAQYETQLEIIANNRMSETPKYRNIPHIGSRREKRARGRKNWMVSIVK